MRLLHALLFGFLVGVVFAGLVVLLAGIARADTFIDEQTPVAISAQVPCTGTSSIVIPGKPPSPVQKHAWTLLNMTAVDVFVCFAPTCLTTTGLRLQENMGLSEQTYTGAVSCITGGGVATLATVVR